MLRSIRLANKDVRIVLIPFNENIKRTRVLASRFDVEWWEDRQLLAFLDCIGYQLWPCNPVAAGLYRKLAVFEGPLEHFLYLDVDIVTTSDIVPNILSMPLMGSALLYADSEEQGTILTASNRSSDFEDLDFPWFNAGIFAARRGNITMLQVEQLAASLSADAGILGWNEQSFMNLLLATQGLSATQMHSLHKSFPAFTFASTVEATLRKTGAARKGTASARTLLGNSWPIVHWAGESVRPSMSLRTLFMAYRLNAKAEPVDAANFVVWTSRIKPIARQIKHSRYVRLR